jgi:hypothetical protein
MILNNFNKIRHKQNELGKKRKGNSITQRKNKNLKRSYWARAAFAIRDNNHICHPGLKI